METQHECFVIAPIGEAESETRKRTDQLVTYVIERATTPRYRVSIAHQLKSPGKITVQIVKKIVTSELLVADLTDGNANVYYELCLRHVLDAPAILLIKEDQIGNVPFDLKDMRITTYDLTDPGKITTTIASLKTQIDAVEGHEAQQSNVMADEVGVVTQPQGPDYNITLLGTLLVANRFRYELIDPFFEYLKGGGFPERLKALRSTLSSVMRESARKDWLSRERVRSAFQNQLHRQEVDNLFDDVEEIIPQLSTAMQTEDEKEIKRWLKRWRQNNSRFREIWVKQYGELLSEGKV